MSESEKDRKLIEELNRLREFRDVALQTLIATEMQVDIIRRQAAAQSNPLAAELGRLQGTLREEVIKLRELMRQPLDVDSSNLLQFLREFVERFERETSIGARFVSELDEVDMPQQVCRELARFVQEGMVNVRRLSATQHVVVRLSATDSHWQVTMEGDGRRADYTDKGGRIRERMRLSEGEVTASNIGDEGWRVVVTVPKRQRQGVAE